MMRLPRLLLFLAAAAITVRAVTLEELKSDPHLTPEKFASYFSDFQFSLLEKVQPPEVFLSTKTGDCDDYATLAADLLRERGYTAKLVAVFMPRDIHVVCYVAETRSYLDFNKRAAAAKLEPSSGALEDIAAKVAASFGQPWRCASEFTFRNGVRQFVVTDFPQAAPPEIAAAP